MPDHEHAQHDAPADGLSGDATTGPAGPATESAASGAAVGSGVAAADHAASGAAGRATAPAPLVLAAGGAVATVHPADGGRLGQLTIDGVEQLRGPEHAGAGWAAWGSYPLVPWSNRIPDGIVATRDGTFTVPVNWPDDHSAIHGLGADVAWDVVAADERSADLRARLVAGRYDVTATQSFELRAGHLDHTLAVTNEADTTVPVGLGFHPWFVAGPVMVPAEAYWPGATPLPEGPPLPMTPEFDVRVPRRLAPMDRCYTRLTDNVATIGDLTLSWSGPIAHVVVYSGVAGWVCIEPVTMANDGFNMWAAGFGDATVRLLALGDSLQVKMRYSWGSADPLR